MSNINIKKRGSNQYYSTIKDLARIILLFNNDQTNEKSISEIAKALNMHQSKVSRMLKPFEVEDFFERNSETGRYCLGIRFFELGVVYALNFPLRKIIRPHIEQIAKELNITASWAILRNSKVISIDRVQNLNVDLRVLQMGLNAPIHSTSIGKVLLAHLSEEEQDRILKSIVLTKSTNKTIIDQRLIKENLKLVRERGYAIDEGEAFEDLNCIAAPIKNGNGNVVAAINLMDKASRTSAERLFQYIDYLKEKALFISRQLGYRGIL